MMGLEFLPIAVGLFGISEVLVIAGETYAPPLLKKIRLRELYPNSGEMKRSVFPICRGSVLGFFAGLIPGPSAVMATFLSYALEKRFSKAPQDFGKGMDEGVVGPESANNSAVMGAMIPLLTLGIPFTASIENSFRKTMMMFRGNIFGFFDKPIALVFLSIAMVFIGVKLLHFHSGRSSISGPDLVE